MKLSIIAAVLVLVIAAIALITWLPANSAKPENGPSNRLQLVATISPLADWLREVGGDHVEVHCLVSGAANPHHFEPTMQDATRIGQSTALFAVGLELDPWAEKLARNSGRDVRLFATGTWITPLPFAAHVEDGDAHHGHSHGSSDPHYWLDPERAMKVVLKMSGVLAQLDPAHAQDYDARAEAYIEKLSALDEELQGAAGELHGKQVVTFHDAFGYLFRRLGLRVAAVIQTTPGVEPGAREVVEAVAAMKNIGQTVVFYEPQSDPAKIEQLAQAVGGTTKLLDPLDTSNSTAGKTYLERMRHNIAILRTTLATNLAEKP